jgi:hypothetical protein
MKVLVGVVVVGVVLDVVVVIVVVVIVVGIVVVVIVVVIVIVVVCGTMDAKVGSVTRRRFRICHICQDDVPESRLLVHKETCMCCMPCLADGHGAISQQADGKLLLYYIGGVGRKISNRVVKSLKKMKELECDIIRPQHRGKLFGVGWHRRDQRFGTHTRVMKRHANSFLRMLLELPLSVRCRLDIASASNNIQNFVALRLPTTSVGGSVFEEHGTSFFTSENYVPCVSAADHPPPPQIKRLFPTLFQTDCSESCDACRLEGHHACPHCCLHYVQNDSGLTIGIAAQRRRVVTKQRAILILDEETYEVRGGVYWIMNGRTLLHGVWTFPQQTVPFHGAAFVSRSVVL